MYLKTALYTNLQSVDADQHKGYYFEAQANYKFAENFHACPVALVEFPLLSKNYPIAFVEIENRVTPIAVLGIRKERNVFIDSKQQWLANTYVPTLIRTYPFTIDKQATTLQLSMAANAKQLNKDKLGVRLFEEDGTLGEQMQLALNFLKSFHPELEKTQDFCEHLQASAVLQQNPTQFILPTGEASTINSYLTVDKNKLHALKDSELALLARKGFLEGIYSHLNSLHHFEHLINLTRSSRR